MLGAFVGSGGATAFAQPVETASQVSSADAHRTTPSPSPSIDQTRITDLENRVSDLHDFVDLILPPLAILIGILGAGGALGIVFSVRDQRRISQLHELSVSSEVSTQRRSEQSYSWFLEESQKTLSLVNETLALAKEATQEAALTGQRKAESNLRRIELGARDLIDRELQSGRFRNALDPEIRPDLERIAGELRHVEGYMLLQDLELKPYSRFVKGISQFLNNNMDDALRTLREGAEDASVRELQLFCKYWGAYIHVALGQYGQAIHIYTEGEHLADPDDEEVTEFESVIADAKFFQVVEEADASAPIERLKAVERILVHLGAVADHFRSTDADPLSSTTMWEVANTRADIFCWISYDSARNFAEPLIEARPGNAAEEAEPFPELAPLLSVPIDEARDALSSMPADAVRYWALRRALNIYEELGDHAKTDPEITFGRAECAFQLQTDIPNNLHDSFASADRVASSELSAHREQRQRVEMASIVLISVIRRKYLVEQLGSTAASVSENDVNAAYRQAQSSLGEMPHRGVNIKSAVQRVPLDWTSYTHEIDTVFTSATGESQ